MDFYRKELGEVYKELYSSEKGLSSAEAKANLEKYGYNKIEGKKGVHPVILFLQQFNNPVIWVLIGAAILSAILGEIVDLYVILVILIANAIIGFIQEYKAEKAIDALKKMASLKATVIREGEEVEINAEELVPGDIILLTAGAKVPADARLISLINLQVEEASLTGESVPVKKEITTYKQELQLGDMKNMIFSGTIITEGKAKAIVVKTGMQTEIGKIATLIDAAEVTLTPLQLKLDHLGKFLTKLILGICLVIFLILYLRKETFIVAIETAASLAVAAIPEGLPVVVTVSLAIGVRRMIKRNALVRKLPSVETLGSTNVICTDKTGTLTKNEMTVTKIYVDDKLIDVSGSGYQLEGTFSEETKDLDLLLKIGALNNDAKLVKDNSKNSITGDPTEACLLVSAQKAGINYKELSNKYPRLDELLFDSTRKRMTTVHKIEGSKVSYVKGAPDIILNLCDKIIIDGKIRKLDDFWKKKIMKVTENLSNDALRVLGFAYKEVTGKDYENNLIFVGLQGMIDPPREEVKEAIKKCKSAGIRVIMITGDYKGTAVAIARELGIVGKAITGAEIKDINLDKEIEHICVYARVNPEHKMQIINALKKKGHVVAMTGDGVNDAPALKASDIGIAMGITGTDVAKEASGMILTDDNFASIVNAIEEGRGVYDNIRKYFSFLISGNIGEVLIITLGIIFGWPLILTATQILLINLVTDGLPAVALSADPFEPNAMSRKPRSKKESIYSGLTPFIIYYPAMMTTVAMGMFAWFYFGAGDLLKAQTAAFVTISMFEFFQAFTCRSIIYPVFKVGLFKNKWLITALFISLIVTFGLVFIPSIGNIIGIVSLTITEIAAIILLSSSGAVFIEIWKYLKHEI